MRSKRSLNPAKLNPHPANLDLMVAPPMQLDQPIRTQARQVAHAVEPRSRQAAERIGNELLGRPIRMRHIAPRYRHPSDIKLAAFASLHRLQAIVENVGAAICNRPARGHTFRSLVRHS